MSSSGTCAAHTACVSTSRLPTPSHPPPARPKPAALYKRVHVLERTRMAHRATRRRVVPKERRKGVREARAKEEDALEVHEEGKVVATGGHKVVGGELEHVGVGNFDAVVLHAHEARAGRLREVVDDGEAAAEVGVLAGRVLEVVGLRAACMVCCRCAQGYPHVPCRKQDACVCRRCVCPDRQCAYTGCHKQTLYNHELEVGA